MLRRGAWPGERRRGLDSMLVHLLRFPPFTAERLPRRGRPQLPQFLERETGLEPATPSLEGSRSTN
jgi:hypothetical protein